jgi:hypothetical protein
MNKEAAAEKEGFWECKVHQADNHFLLCAELYFKYLIFNLYNIKTLSLWWYDYLHLHIGKLRQS